MARIRQNWDCKVEGCNKIHLAKGYCHNHYVKYGQEKKCSFSGCDKNHHAKGYCITHYARHRINGDQITRQRWGKDYTSLEDYLNKNHQKEAGGCWVWTGSFSKRNYGFVGNYSLAKKLKIYTAHRLSFMIHKGVIPEGMLVCHACDNPPCINPSHLFLGTHQDNMKDMDSKNRRKVHRGDKSVKAKLTKDEAIYILQNMETISAWELSTKFNVCRQTIQNVWLGITKYIEPELREKIINNLGCNNKNCDNDYEPGYCAHSGVKLDECQHESDGKYYSSIDWGAPPKIKCKKCGEFYK